MYTDPESLPAVLPEAGFYDHYKRDPNGTFNNYTYYIFGGGHHTEDDVRPEDRNFQIYVPLYEDAFVYKHGKMFDVRPLSFALEMVDKDGYHGPRFVRVTDEVRIHQLITQMRKMWGHMIPW